MHERDHNDIADGLNRLVKLAMDTGEAETVADAHKLFAGYRLAVVAGDDVGHSPTHQAALLTIVNAGRRSLLGGIEVEGIEGMDLLVPVQPYCSLEEAVAGLGGRMVQTVNPDSPLVAIGNTCARTGHTFSIRTTFEGWAAGIVPLARNDMRLAERQEFTPAGVLSGALAVTEAFQFLRGVQPAAGRREVGLSLWYPELQWRDGVASGPVIERLPAALWLIGLGNLGQAYLWTLGMLPYAAPHEVHIVMQDFDVLGASNDSTSLLTNKNQLGSRKTRAIAAWAEQRGFETAIVERRFQADFQVAPDEPALALCGVDNPLARSVLEDVGFEGVIEAGLGSGTSDFLGFRTHVFPGVHKARDLWETTNVAQENPIDLPAYKRLAADGLDHCGLTQLAGRTVGAPFVGATVAAIVVAEALRMVNGAHGYELVDGHLRDLTYLTAVPAQERLPINPGATAASLNWRRTCPRAQQGTKPLIASMPLTMK